MDQTTNTQTADSTDAAAPTSFTKASGPVPPVPPAPPFGDAGATPAPLFSASGFPGGSELPGGAAQPAARPFRLQRSRTDRMIGGVCGGLAQSVGVDVVLLRLGLVALTLLGAGIGIVIYIAAWILAPEADAV